MTATALTKASSFASRQPAFMVPGMTPTTAQTFTPRDQAAGFEVVEAKTTTVAQATIATEQKKTLFQTLTQPKVLIGATVVLSAAGLLAAYYFFPVATTTHAMTVGHAAKNTLIHTRAFLQPGLVANAFVLDVMLKSAGTAIAVAWPVVSPAISFALVAALGTLALLYVLNKVWGAVESAVCRAVSAVFNKIGQELDKTWLGSMIKGSVTTIYSALKAVFISSDTASEVELVEVKKEQTEKSVTTVALPAEERKQVAQVEEPSTSKKVACAAAAALSVGLIGGLFYYQAVDFSPFEQV